VWFNSQKNAQTFAWEKNPAFLAGGSYTMQTAAWHNLDAKLPYEAQWFCCNHCLLVVMFTHSSNLHSFL
jgi:hypothetical protein